MNYGLAYNPAVYPASPATDSNYLFNLLGFFWQRIFQDREVIKGMNVAQAESTIQAYYDLIDLINSYSSYQIPVFDKRKWYPLTITRSDLDNNTLLFGEGVLFGAEVSSNPYVFGRAIPEDPNVYSVILPGDLAGMSIMADQIVSPNSVWVNGQDFYVQETRLFLNGNPFSIPGITATNIYNADGSQATFTYYDSGNNPHTIADQSMILWCYNADIDSQNLQCNVAYLFGLNVPSTEQSKQVLVSVMQNYTNGPTINDIKAVAATSLGLPVIKSTSTIISIASDSDDTVITTGTNVYRYPSVYPLKSGIGVSSVLNAGDVPVQAIDLFDNVNSPGWWKASLSLFSGQKLPLQLPQTMLLSGAKFNVSFTNEVNPVSVDGYGNVTFPVNGTKNDVAAFQAYISTPAMVAALVTYITYIGGEFAGNGSSSVINPVDFIFRSFLQTTSALLRVKFFDINQLGNFVMYFDCIKDTLPPQILFMVLCDISVGGEVFEMNSNISDAAFQKGYPVQKSNDIINMNGNTSLSINDMGFSRVIIGPIDSGDYRNLSLTVVS